MAIVPPPEINTVTTSRCKVIESIVVWIKGDSQILQYQL
jgi:hypothetical protein